MKRILFITILVYIFQTGIAQSPVLVEDYLEGVEGSVEGRMYEYQNTLTYVGTTLDGGHGVLQYDKNSGVISEIVMDGDFENDIFFIGSFSDELFLATAENNSIKVLYRSYERDLSDIEKIYDSGEANIRRFRFYEGYTLIFEDVLDVEEKTNIKIVSPDGEVTTLYSGLSGSGFRFRLTSVNDHFVIAPRDEAIEGESIVLYSLASNSIVPITNLLPDYQDCGLLSRLASINDNILTYECSETIIYDFSRSEYIPYSEGSLFVHYDKDNYIFASINGELFRINKESGLQEDIVDENVRASRTFRSSYLGLIENGAFYNIVYFDFETEELSSFTTTIPTTETSPRFTGFGIVPSGVHTVIYNNATKSGVLVNVNNNEYAVIDSVYDVSSVNRPTAYGDDIFFTHNDPEFGQELFWIDYTTSNTDDIIVHGALVSPNPSSQTVKVLGKDGEAYGISEVRDMNGNVIFTNINTQELEVNQLSSGVYLLKYNLQNGRTASLKFVKR